LRRGLAVPTRGWLWLAPLAAACAASQHVAGGEPGHLVDGSASDAQPADAEAADARPPDSAAGPDSAPPDSAPPDSAPPDSAPPDSASPDTRPPALRLDAIDPTSGLASAVLPGALVRGDGFTATTTVRLGSTPATNCTLLAPTELRCDLPAAPGGLPAHVDVVVSDPPSGPTATLPAGFTYTAVSTDVTWCDVQWPPSATAAAGTASPYMYGQIYQAGLTDSTSSPAPGITGQLGFGPTGSDPRASNAWRYLSATPNPAWNFAQNNDEYYAQLTVAAAGSYLYAFRFSLDGGLHFTYCDLDPANGGFDPAHQGLLTVTP